MPLLKFYTSPNQLTPAEKQELATILTARYTRLLPAFYVSIIFNEIPADNFFMGGKVTEGKFVRLVIEHIAINWDEHNKTPSNPKDYLAFVGEVLRERFEPKGWTWEFNVVESKKELWRLQSLVPPPMGSEAYALWKKEDRALPWEAEIEST